MAHSSYESESFIPNEYICPITNNVMDDPVIAADGYTYERSSITEWFRRGHRTSPLTNLQLTDTSLRVNQALRKLIADFLEQNSSHKLQIKSDLQFSIQLIEDEIKNLQAKETNLQESGQKLLSSDSKILKDGIQGLKSDLNFLKSDIQGLKTDSKSQLNALQTVKSEVLSAKSEIQTVKSEVLAVKSEIREFKSEIQSEFNKLKTVIDNLIKLQSNQSDAAKISERVDPTKYKKIF